MWREVAVLKKWIVVDIGRRRRKAAVNPSSNFLHHLDETEVKEMTRWDAAMSG